MIFCLVLNVKVMELIDTCWDVNQPVKAMSAASALGINRYMLGCKSGFKGGKSTEIS